MLRWALLLVILSTSALASRADRLSVSPRLDRRDRLGATVAAPDPVLLSISLLPPDSECSGTPPDGVTFTRSSAATCIDSSGVAHALATNEARVHGTLGLLVEGSATNAVLHSRDVTAAPWIGTGCAKTGTGMDGFTSVGRCTGATSAIQILTVATGARTASAYVRRQSGTCNVQLKADAETTSKSLLGGWERLTLTYTSDGAVTLEVSVSSGCVVDIDYVQDEAGSIATSPIVTGGTAAVRAQEVGSIPYAQNFNPLQGCAALEVAPLWSAPLDRGAVAFLSGNNLNTSYLYSNAGAGSVLVSTYAGGAASNAAANYEASVPRKYSSEWSAQQDVLMVTNQTDSVSGPVQAFSGWSPPQDGVTIRLGSRGADSAFAHLRNLVLGATPEACQ